MNMNQGMSELDFQHENRALFAHIKHVAQPYEAYNGDTNPRCNRRCMSASLDSRKGARLDIFIGLL
jgi:hypothetical protein